MKWLLIGFIRAYQLLLSPVLPPSCIHQPTCSRYALEALERYGFIRGTFMSIRRLLHCHPFSRGGYDPVP
ncbi:MAG: membrane protein insertion efficiency factor YidD [Mariprofundaceae bacterium]